MKTSLLSLTSKELSLIQGGGIFVDYEKEIMPGVFNLLGVGIAIGVVWGIVKIVDYLNKDTKVVATSVVTKE